MFSNKLIATLEELEKYIELTDQERAWFEANNKRLPFLVSPYYLSLLDHSNVNDPLRKQVIPTISENQFIVGEEHDPLAEVNYSVFPRLIHRYKNRVALLVTDRCLTYCRHCFRRRFTATEHNNIGEKELKEISLYLKEKSEVKEILITGGDPLTLSNEKIDEILYTLRKERADLVIRLATRALVTFPFRIDDKLVEVLKKYNQVGFYVMTQFNHPNELNEVSVKAINKLVDNGLVVLNQSVLLKDVNDDVSVLETLMNKLVTHRVKPYYLFQGDLVEGTAHLRVSLKRGLEIERELRKRLSGLAMPLYAVDLPQGGGKVALTKNYLKEIDKKRALFETPEGEERIYYEVN